MLDREAIAGRLRGWRTAALWTVLVVAALAGLRYAVEYRNLRAANDLIRQLNAGADVAIDAQTASGPVVLARVNELIRRDRFDEAQGLANSTVQRMTPRLRAETLYNLANDRVRRAIALIEKGNLDGATALVNVAKGEYRLALRTAPEDWNTKYNLDVAMRMVRDLPISESDEEEPPPDAPTRVWTDLPRIPKGLP